MAVTKLSRAYVENGNDSVSVFRLKKSNYDGALASLLGIVFGDAPNDKAIVSGSVGVHSAALRLVEIRISYQFKPDTTRQASIYCAPLKVDDACKNQGAALRALKYNGKQILSIRDN
jgi:hypothetical protein